MIRFTGRRCAVCGVRIGREWWANDRGDVWCDRHTGWAECRFCGIPTRDAFRTTPRCARCADGAVDRAEDLAAAFTPVRDALERRGFRVRGEVRVVLRSTEKLVATGAFPSATTCGQTRWLQDHRNAASRLTILLAAGLPRVDFQSTVAHEWAHAFIAQRGRVDLPPQLSEGFAQFVAHEYLVLDCPGPEAAGHARQIAAEPDPVYGGGYRRIRSLVDRHGTPAVIKALVQGPLDVIASWET